MKQRTPQEITDILGLMLGKQQVDEMRWRHLRGLPTACYVEWFVPTLCGNCEEDVIVWADSFMTPGERIEYEDLLIEYMVGRYQTCADIVLPFVRIGDRSTIIADIITRRQDYDAQLQNANQRKAATPLVQQGDD